MKDSFFHGFPQWEWETKIYGKSLKRALHIKLMDADGKTLNDKYSTGKQLFWF